MRRVAVLLLVLLLGAVGCGSGSGTPAAEDNGPTPGGSVVDTTGGTGAAASCAAAVDYDGSLYLGYGELKREPATTGRSLAGSVPSCNDTGGDDVSPPEQVQLAELEDVPPETAVLFNGGLFVREGADLPAAAQPWFEAPACTTEGAFDLRGDWLGVESPNEPRYDGDIRPPYRVEVRVTEGPEEYAGATIQVHADAATDPSLGPDDVKSSLWEGGQVIARATCDDDRFRALSLRVPES